MNDSSMKICVLGDSAVGKSSLLDVFIGRTPDPNRRIRSGVRIETGLVATPAGPRELVVWDILCADSGFVFETPYLTGMHGALVVCDCTRRPTVTASRALIKRIDDEFPSAPAIIVVNKTDLRQQAEVSDEEIDQLKLSGVPVVSASATSGENVKRAFEQLAALVADHG